MSLADQPGAPPPEGPIALDGLVYGIELLDALLVLHLGDAHVYASWIRPDSGIRADDVTTTLRDVYRVGQFAARRLTGAADRRGDAPAPVLTVELPHRTAILRRVRAYTVTAIFDAAMPLGMARLVAARLTSALEPELPLTPEAPAPRIAPPPPPPPAVVVEPPPAPAVVPAHEPPAPAVVPAPPIAPPPPPPEPRPPLPSAPEPVFALAVQKAEEAPPNTLTFGSGLPRRSHAPPPRSPEAERAGRLVAYLEAHAPEPHVVKYRLALRAGLTLSALENPEALGPEAMVLIETAVQDILGLDRAELRRIA